MTDIVDDLRNPMWAHSNIPFESPQLEQEENLAAMRAAADEIERLRSVVGFVESWVSNPVGAYSIYALDGLFGMTRDKIATLSAHSQHDGEATAPILLGACRKARSCQHIGGCICGIDPTRMD